MAMMLQEDEGKGFSLLGEEECRGLLEQATIGRVALSVGCLPAVFPVNYVSESGRIYFLTGEGTKLDAALRETCVGFEIDHVDVRYHHGWSVMAWGKAREVAPPEAAALLDHLPLEPWAPGPRGHLVCIEPEILSGRRIGFAAPDMP